jgi:hypothetical protein
MISEWMKVMLEEISRKKAEADESRIERQRRRDEQGARVVIESQASAREQKIVDPE